MGVIDLTVPGKARAVHFDTSKRPMIGWTQTDDSLAIIVRVASAKDAKATVEKRKVTITVEGPDGEKYQAALPLDGIVDPSEDAWSVQIRRLTVKVQLKKAKDCQEEWDRLVTIPVRDTKSWLEYDWDAHDEVEVEDVEPDEKEQPDEEPKKRRAPDEPVKPVETKEEKQKRWSAAQEKIKSEAEAVASATKKRAPPGPAPLQFTLSQLLVLLLVTIVFTAIVTHVLTRWALAPGVSSSKAGEL